MIQLPSCSRERHPHPEKKGGGGGPEKKLMFGTEILRSSEKTVPKQKDLGRGNDWMNTPDWDEEGITLLQA